MGGSSGYPGSSAPGEAAPSARRGVLERAAADLRLHSRLVCWVTCGSMALRAGGLLRALEKGLGRPKGEAPNAMFAQYVRGWEQRAASATPAEAAALAAAAADWQFCVEAVESYKVRPYPVVKAVKAVAYLPARRLLTPSCRFRTERAARGRGVVGG